MVYEIGFVILCILPVCNLLTLFGHRVLQLVAFFNEKPDNLEDGLVQDFVVYNNLKLLESPFCSYFSLNT